MKRQMKIFPVAVTLTLLSICIADAARAQGTANIDDPAQVTALIDLLMTGKYIPAVGAFLIALVTLARTGGGAVVPWLRTKAGGLVLGYGSSLVLYVGLALRTGPDRVTLGLLFTALGAGWAAAGGFEHLSDLIAAFRPSKPSQIPTAVAVKGGGPPSGGTGAAIQAAIVLGVASICLVFGGLVMQACSGAKHAGTVIVDCTKADAAQTSALLDELKPLLSGGSISWSAIEQKALAAGETIGGCVLAQLVQDALSSTKATPVETTWDARGALEDARARWNPANVWHTAKGEI